MAKKKPAKKKLAKKTPAKKPPAWKLFEQAVAQFIRAIDPKAIVEENAKPPDVDTNRPRQRDVLVRATVCNHYAVTILVSCKLKKRRLSEEDIDHFVGEIRSASAQLGVIYAAAFTEPAIEKARKIGISCCTLLQNATPRIPQQLLLTTYHCRPRIGLSISRPIDPAWSVNTYRELFAVHTTYKDKTVSVLDIIGDISADLQRASVKGDMPDHNNKSISIVRSHDPSAAPLAINVMVGWRYYISRLEAHLLNGSYSFTEQSFVGSQTAPIIDSQGPHPGEGWEELTERPVNSTGRMVIVFLNSAEQITAQLREGLADKPIPRPF